MLTKDLLHYRTRSGRVYPQFLKTRDPDLLALAEGLISQFRLAPGRAVGEVAQATDDVPGADHPRTPALRKLLLDRCDEAEDDGTVAARRWDILAAAQALRQQQHFATIQAFRQALGQSLQAEPQALSDGLYGDLPDERLIKSFDDLAAEALLHRHNAAQVQGLLIHARSIRVVVRDAPLAARRAFFRCLKFQRLLSEVEPLSGADFAVTLSGPLAVFQQAQSYGLRLANFFPYILHLPRWELTAELKLNQQRLELELDQSVGISSHYREMRPHIPEELTAFLDSFNGRSPMWKAAAGVEFVHLGRQSYCFPDITFTGQGGQQLHLELFHRWHAAQLPSRLEAASAARAADLMIGVEDALVSQGATAELLAQSAWFKDHGLTFKTFPTPKTLLALLATKTTAAPAPQTLTDGAELKDYWQREPTARSPASDPQ